MKTEYLAKLEAAIFTAMDIISESGEHPGYVYDTLVEDMTKAASLVYDASMVVQKFMRDECGVE